VICYDPTRLFVGDSYINHPDHRAVGQAALDAISPTAAMPLAFPEQIEEGLEPHRVRQIMAAATQHPDTWIDIGETLDLKLEALRRHESQHDGRRDLNTLIRGWAETAGAEVGLQYAEAFRRILRPEGLN
jgi:LmbE family N-acetylglucosaminyl deacetylase